MIRIYRGATQIDFFALSTVTFYVLFCCSFGGESLSEIGSQNKNTRTEMVEEEKNQCVAMISKPQSLEITQTNASKPH